jgi:hypothetical protein
VDIPQIEKIVTGLLERWWGMGFQVVAEAHEKAAIFHSAHVQDSLFVLREIVSGQNSS